MLAAPFFLTGKKILMMIFAIYLLYFTMQVHITSQTECHFPFGVGMASDPMALRRGGKKLPMEDACFYEWPLPGQDQVCESS